MSIKERVARTEAQRARTRIEDSYDHGWMHRAPRREVPSEVWEVLGYIGFAAIGLLALGYVLPRFLESIH